MSVSLRKKAISGNRYAYYLDYYTEGKRRREFLKLYQFQKPKDPVEKQHNKEVQELAKSILYKRQQEEIAGEHGADVSFKRNTNFLTYVEKWAADYTKKDKRVVIAMLTYLKGFIGKTFPGKDTIKPAQVTESFCIDFKEYLEDHLQGETPATYFARFKKLLRKAARDKILLINPGAEVKNTRAEGLKKDVLTIEELQLLAKADCSNIQVKRSFLFACYSGLRFADILELEWNNINGNVLSFVQTKTEKKSPHKVQLNLNSVSLQLLGDPGKSNDKVFTLPSHTGVLKALKKWAKTAGIQKHVTFHCARHSFATNLLFYQTDLMTVSNLLGHTSTKHTQKYVRIAESMKQQAISRLPEVEL
ncbi:site-specific integrase [Xanthocytophaga agilis]|uniref:Site-specific integrase n=1 Tax=Xanthocytophaga agilis TaxID=3048010 RepID=A0AAE3RC79_9BACT|nr:site-specific integrase [Xanthocytophaga agilis]MDJ1505534.1 site-specific integrase [Xanthocytophaga agilis]